MTVDAETLNTLLDSSDVDSIHEDIPVPPTLNLSIPRIGATTMHASGIDRERCCPGHTGYRC